MNVTRVNITIPHYKSWAPPKTENYALEFFMFIMIILLMVILQRFAHRNLQVQLRRAQTI